MGKIIRHNIIKHITDHPGEVVYKDTIVQDGGFTPNQVSAAVLAIQRDSTLGSEIETVVPGNAWRYVPNHQRNVPSASTIMERNDNLSVPLTQLLRRYLTDRPNVDVELNELIEFTGRTEEQVKVGMNNLRNGHLHMRQTIVIVDSGRRWSYQPARRRTESTPTTPIPVRAQRHRQFPEPTVVPTSEPVESTSTGELTGSPRLFEEVGSLDDGSIIIRGDEGELYRAIPVRS
jgi:hypothetical protein